MKTIIVSKMGSPFYTRDYAAKNSASGEQGETEGLLRHLVSRGDLRVIYFGLHYGSVDGVTFIPPHTEGLDEFTTDAIQQLNFRYDEEIDFGEPIGFLEVTGYSPTMAYVKNPNFATVQAAAVRYVAPQMNLMRWLGLPRLVINNDPRNYPKNQEMSLVDDVYRPRALLDQCTEERTQIIGRKRYVRRSVYAACESWGYLGSELAANNERDLSCTMIAHAHITDGIRHKERASALSKMLSPEIDLPPDMYVYGKGWEQAAARGRFQGPVRPNEVIELLARSSTCPVISHTENFATGKPYLVAHCGCLPLFYGRGEPFTYDPTGSIVPLDSGLRFQSAKELAKLAAFFHADQDARIMALKRIRDHLKPSWQLLDNLLDELKEGVDVTSDRFYQRYGGYRAC